MGIKEQINMNPKLQHLVIAIMLSTFCLGFASVFACLLLLDLTVIAVYIFSIFMLYIMIHYGSNGSKYTLKF